MNPRKISLHPFSLCSLKVQTFFSENPTRLWNGTGYVIKRENYYYLVSNFHVFSGRAPETNEVLDKRGSIPDKIKIFHHSKNNAIENYQIVTQDLIKDNEPAYLSHKPQAADVAILPLELNDDIQVHPLDCKDLDVRLFPGAKVSIVGFPFGLPSFANLPIWKIGHLAMEISLSFQDRPCWLIDAATRGGMSGAPVFAVLDGSYQNSEYNRIYTQGIEHVFLGTYSGRLKLPKEYRDTIAKELVEEIEGLGTDIGMVWFPNLIDKILIQNA